MRKRKLLPEMLFTAIFEIESSSSDARMDGKVVFLNENATRYTSGYALCD